MQSLDELNRMKERVLRQQKEAEKGLRARVLVAMGTCGIASGATDTMATIVSELDKLDISDVEVSKTGCLGLCAFEPVVQIQVGKNDPAIYGKITPEHVPTLIEKHVLQGEVVTKWLVK
jgi:NADP-reducing hydrogenase subunit HndB